jgi:cold shock protein
MPQGPTKWFNDEKGYGFISQDEGSEDLFVHHSEIAGERFKTIEGAPRSPTRRPLGQEGPQGRMRLAPN